MNNEIKVAVENGTNITKKALVLFLQEMVANTSGLTYLRQQGQKEMILDVLNATKVAKNQFDVRLAVAIIKSDYLAK